MTRRLDVCLHEPTAGAFTQDDAGNLSFTDSADYLARTRPPAHFLVYAAYRQVLRRSDNAILLCRSAEENAGHEILKEVRRVIDSRAKLLIRSTDI